MKVKETLFISSLAALMLLASTTSVLAWGGYRNGASPDHDAMLQALENKDYQAWQKVLNGDEHHALCADFISEDEFGDFAEQKLEAMQSRRDHREAIHQALEDRDYETWQELMQEHPRAAHLTEQITAKNFDEFAKSMDLMEAGDFEGARELREQLGLNMGRMGKTRKGFRMHQ